LTRPSGIGRGATDPGRTTKVMVSGVVRGRGEDDCFSFEIGRLRSVVAGLRVS